MNSEQIDVYKIEQNLVFEATRIRQVWKSYLRRPWRNDMKIRLSLLFCGVVLIAVVPARADRIPYPGSTKDSADSEITAQVSRSSGLNAPVGAGFRAEPLPRTEFVGTIDVHDAFNVRGSWSSPVPNSIFSPLAGTDIHLVKLGGLEFDERDFFDSNAGKASRHDGKENKENDKFNGKDGAVPVLVREPGSLSVLLLGLGAVGLLARRRGELPITS
jgi:hypothetical protein